MNLNELKWAQMNPTELKRAGMSLNKSKWVQMSLNELGPPHDPAWEVEASLATPTP